MLEQHTASGDLTKVITSLDTEALKTKFQEQDEFIAIEDFLPDTVLNELLASLPALESRVHRNYIPKHKKGGSISRHTLDTDAPIFAGLYKYPVFRKWLEELTGQQLLSCHGQDPHAYALYYYTEAGDHIGWHYDTSYYLGERYTVLFGLVDESKCSLEYELYRRDKRRCVESGAVSLKPGMFVIFNGDKLFHRVTPAAAAERRIVLTLEYVTDIRMHGFKRFVSNMKDAIAYFGFARVFSPVLKTRINYDG